MDRTRSAAKKRLHHLAAPVARPERRSADMTPRLLIVEDDEALSALLAYNLTAEGFDAVFVTSGDEALAAIAKHNPHLVILDWMVPGLTGLELCRILSSQSETAGLPIIMLTAKGLPRDKVLAFDAGVDDYIVKPFSVAELIARIHGLLRRTTAGRETAKSAVGGLEIEAFSYQARFRGVEVVLTPIEFRMLKLFMERHGRVLTRAQLIESVWYDAKGVNDRTVDIHIGHLRRSLMAAGAPDVIRTVRGAGYMLDLDEENPPET